MALQISSLKDSSRLEDDGGFVEFQFKSLPEDWKKNLSAFFEFASIFSLRRLIVELVSGQTAFIAGGMFKDIFRGIKPKDIDLYFRTETDFNIAKEKFLKNHNATFENENCIGFFDGDIRVELILRKFGTPREIMSEFDFTVVQCSLVSIRGENDFDKWEFVAGKSFIKDLKDMRLTLSNPDAERLLERVNRYYHYGFSKRLTDSTLNEAFKYSCEAFNCEEIVSGVSTVRYFSFLNNCKFGRTSSSQSYSSDLLLTNKILHQLSHLVKNGEDLKYFELDVNEQVLKNFQEFEPAINSYSGFRGDTSYLLLTRLLLKYKNKISPEARKKLLVLIFSGSITDNQTGWKAGAILEEIFSFNDATDSWDGFHDFIDDLMDYAGELPTPGEWSEGINSALLNYELPMAFLFELFKDSNHASRERASVKSKEIYSDIFIKGVMNERHNNFFDLL